jgi:hypothetical protein
VKKFSLILAVILLFSSIFSVSVTASAEYSSDYLWKYELTTYAGDPLCAKISGFNDKDKNENASIPEKIDGQYTVVSVLGETFANKPNLKSISVPKTVYDFSYAAVKNCPALDTITVDPDNPYLSDGGCCNVIYNKADNAVCFGIKTSVIPDGTFRINTKAFKDCKELTHIDFPSSLRQIYSYAFAGTGLTELVFPEGVTGIADGAFSGCRIKKLVLPESLTNLHLSVFDASALKELIIPKNVEQLEGSFDNFHNIEKLSVDAGNKYFDSRNNCNAVIRKSDSALVMTCGNTVIPDGVKVIGSTAYRYDSVIENIVIPHGVKSIENKAFWGCKKLKYIVVPDTVDFIYDYALDNAESLTDIYYEGTQEQWDGVNLTVGNSLKNITVHYESSGPAEQADGSAVPETAASTAVKKKNTLKIKKVKKSVTVKYKKLKKKSASLKIEKLIKVTNAKGKLSYAKVKGNKKITVDKKSGKIKLKKGLKKGTYKLRIKVTAKGTKKYKKASKTVTVTIKVK